MLHFGLALFIGILHFRKSDCRYAAVATRNGIKEVDLKVPRHMQEDDYNLVLVHILLIVSDFEGGRVNFK